MEVRESSPAILDLHSELRRSDYPLLTGSKRLRHHPKGPNILMRLWRFVDVGKLAISHTHDKLQGNTWMAPRT